MWDIVEPKGRTFVTVLSGGRRANDFFSNLLGWHAPSPMTHSALEISRAEDAFVAALEARAIQVSKAMTGLDGSRSMATLVEGIQELSATYNRRHGDLRSVPTSLASLRARLEFFLPRDAPKTWLPLAEVWEFAQLAEKRSLRMLDLGAGTGATSLGACGFIHARNPSATFTVRAVDSFELGLEAFERLLQQEATPALPRIDLTAIHADLHKWIQRQPDEPNFDLIVMGLVLNEGGLDDASLDRASASIRQALKLLAPGGAMIIIEPALRVVSRWLQQLRDRLEAAEWCTLFAPCPTIQSCPLLENPDDWCHQALARALPPNAAKLAQAASLRSQRLTFSYLTLVQPGSPRLAELRGEPTTTQLRVVSDPLPSKGKLELVLCGNQGKRIGMRLERDRSGHNDAFSRARRGDFLVFEAEEKLHTPKGLRFRIEKDRKTQLVRATDTTEAD